MRDMDVGRFANGQIAAMRAVIDQRGMEQQLGAVPSSGTIPKKEDIGHVPD